MADPDERLTVLGPHVHDGVRLSEAAAAAGVPERTARRWLAAYEADGAAGLVRSARADRGEHRIPGEMRALIEGMALRRPPPRAAEVHRAVVAVAAEKGWPEPSYPVVRRIIAALDRGLVTMAHHGPEAYRNDFELVLRRESAHPNDLWQADHTELDVMVLDETGKPARPWLTVILDDHSRAVAGYTVFLGDPTALQTALALRQAVWRKTDPGWTVCGLPAALYSDHGADFTSTHLAQVCADVKVQLIHSTPGVPRGRGKIERLFGTITTELLPTLPGHIPPKNHGKPVSPPALTLSQLDAAVGRYMGHLPPAGAPRDRANPGDPLGRGWVAAQDARLAGSARPAAADGCDTTQGAARRDPLPRTAVLLPDVGRVRRRRGHRPVRPTRPGRDPRVSPWRVPVSGCVTRDRRGQHLPQRPPGRTESAAA